MRDVVLNKSRDVEIVQDAGGVFHVGGKVNRDVDAKKGYIFSNFCNF
jgi:hypothetical protein